MKGGGGITLFENRRKMMKRGKADFHRPFAVGFDEIMPETRKYLRFFPRPFKRPTIHVGPPITHLLSPLVDKWRSLASTSTYSTPGIGIGIGGKWGSVQTQSLTKENLGSESDAERKVEIAERNQPERMTRSLLNGEEKAYRMKITEILRDQVQRLGEKVEEEQGKQGNTWRNAVVVDPSVKPLPKKEKPKVPV